MTYASPNRRTLALLAATARRPRRPRRLLRERGASDQRRRRRASGTKSEVTAPSGEWTFTDDRGETVTLDEAPTTIAADAATAGGLWEYGIDVDGGVFGDIVLPDGTPSPGIGLADPDDFESVGDANQINLEELAAQRPAGDRRRHVGRQAVLRDRPRPARRGRGHRPAHRHPRRRPAGDRAPRPRGRVRREPRRRSRRQDRRSQGHVRHRVGGVHRRQRGPARPAGGRGLRARPPRCTWPTRRSGRTSATTRSWA